MLDSFLEWLLVNKIEVLGAILGILYIIFSIKQNLLTWPTGLLTSVLYVIVFFQSKFYADMGLQVYYVVISIYGWYYWLKGAKEDEEEKVPVKQVSKHLWIKLSIAVVTIYLTILIVLLKFTDSDVPFMDSLTTAFSIVATWMLARKYIEHWLIWIFVDLFSAALYLYKNLWATSILFIVYTFMAAVGFYQWKKDSKLQKLNKLPKIIVVTGAESTGKSALAESLANHFNVPLIPEIAREYVENLDRKYNYTDVEIVARKQVDKLKHFRKTTRPFVFVDTWLIITKIWFEVVFREVPKWIENEIQNTPIDLFLVCDIDLPWVPDLVRENGGKSREILQKKYIEQIEYYKFNYRIISGENEKRIENALNSLKFE